MHHPSLGNQILGIGFRNLFQQACQLVLRHAVLEPGIWVFGCGVSVEWGIKANKGAHTREGEEEKEAERKA